MSNRTSNPYQPPSESDSSESTSQEELPRSALESEFTRLRILIELWDGGDQRVTPYIIKAKINSIIRFLLSDSDGKIKYVDTRFKDHRLANIDRYQDIEQTFHSKLLREREKGKLDYQLLVLSIQESVEDLRKVIERRHSVRV